MWTRKELKEKGKLRFKANYWRCVLVALILALVTSGFSNSGKRFDAKDFNHDEIENSIENSIEDVKLELDGEDLIKSVDRSELSKPVIAGMVAGFTIIFLIFFLLFIGVVFCIDAFIFCPIEVSCRKYFIDNLNSEAKLNTLGTGFTKNYLNVVKTMFLKSICTVLWGLLFIVPGIIKIYEYRMIPYLLADDPNMDSKEAFAKSKQMMKGNKWDAFVLDLSFLGWHILGLLTIGILEVFYVNPYEGQTDAALYERLLSQKTEQPTVDSHYVEVE